MSQGGTCDSLSCEPGEDIDDPATFPLDHLFIVYLCADDPNISSFDSGINELTDMIEAVKLNPRIKYIVLSDFSGTKTINGIEANTALFEISKDIGSPYIKRIVDNTYLKMNDTNIMR